MEKKVHLGRLVVEATSDGICLRLNFYDDEFKSIPCDISKKDSPVVAQLLTRALFAFTNLPPTSIQAGTVEWGFSSPSNSSSDGINEHIHPGATE